MLESADCEHPNPRLSNREIIFEDFQPMRSRYLNVTDGQTDGRTNDFAVASPGENEDHLDWTRPVLIRRRLDNTVCKLFAYLV